MSRHPALGKTRRAGATNPVVIALLGAILVALVVLIVLLVSGRKEAVTPTGSSDNKSQTAGVNPGQKVSREDLPNPPKKPKTIGDEKRIKEVAQVGKTYEVLVKGGFDARVEDKDWGTKTVTNLGYACEGPVTRTIESNDGKTVVELRQFGSMRTVKLLTEVESVKIQLGLPGELALGALEFFVPGAGVTALAAKPVAEAILGASAQQIADNNAKVFGQVDSLSAKKVRITYVDGVGVQSVEPLGCSLTESERNFIFNTAVLSDVHTMPDINVKPGETWTVSAAQFAGFLDPSLRGVPEGEVVIQREANHEENGKQYATLKIQRGLFQINSSDASTRRIGNFTPRGTLRYNITDGYVESAHLTGDMNIEEVSRDHILFESSFRTRPKLEISYSCKIQ